MQKYLSDTQEMVRKGKYKEALERFVWFHEHALEHDPAMTGVRLSFAVCPIGRRSPTSTRRRRTLWWRCAI